MESSRVKLPKMGLGVWQLSNKECAKTVLKGLEIGYRLIDTAQIYGNESGVGEALDATWVSREDLILATKIWITNYSPRKLLRSLKSSLTKLKTTYVDLLYLHWPAKLFYKPDKTLRAFCEAVDQGLVRHLAVSNFSSREIEVALNIMNKPIVANQIEHHPLLQQRFMQSYLKEKNMYLVAYSPLVRSHMNEIPEITQIARDHGVSEAQVTLAWEMSHGAVPIPKSSSEAHLTDNFAAQTLELTSQEIESINSIKTVKRMFNPPMFAPKWDD
jgi:diketogulonate reductase-like aldo/keto reductase